MFLVRCARGSWNLRGERRLVVGRRLLSLESPPNEVVTLFRRAVALLGLRQSPQLAWVDTLGGSVGLHADGLVVLGAADLRELAQHVRRDYLREVSDLELYLERVLGYRSRYVTDKDLWHAVVSFTIAHELGHAYQQATGFRGTVLEGERDADITAGMIGAAAGWDRMLQRFVAHAVGCTDAFSCDHPAPHERVALRDRGERLLLRAA